MQREELVERLLDQAQRMIQTGFSQIRRTCGTASCGCHRDKKRKHGPYTYVSFRTLEGRASGMYVPAAHVEEVQRGRQAWREFQKTARSLAALNRQEMKRRWGRKGGVPS